VAVRIDLVPLLVAVLGALGGGAGIKAVIDGLLKVRSGMSARENSRKIDIVQQRDAAIQREERAWKLVDEQAARRREAQEYAARLRRRLIDNGIEPEPELVQDRTITREELDALRGENE
jgi:hypothetical protein